MEVKVYVNSCKIVLIGIWYVGVLEGTACDVDISDIYCGVQSK